MDGFQATPGGEQTVESSPGGELAQQEQQEDGAQESSFNVGDAIGKENITDLLAGRLQTIAADCMANYRIDETNFKSRRDRIEQLYKLAMQVKEAKNYPFENASNVKYPLLTKAALSFASMAYPAIVKDDTVVKGKVVGNDDGGEVVKGADGQPIVDQNTNQPMRKNAGLKAKRADRVATHMSYQILECMDGWENDMDKICHIIPIIGIAFKKTYRDFIEKENVSKLVLPQYLIVNIDAKTLNRASRISEIMELYPNEIEENKRLGIFDENFSYLSAPPTETQAATYKPELASNTAGQDADLPHQFIEMHCWIDLDDDGYQEPYIVWIHKATEKVARVMARYDQEDIIALKVDTDASGVVTYDRIQKINAECYYEDFPFMPDPEGSIYAIGFGHILQDLNESANTSINQLIDAGHRYVMGGGFVGSGLRIKSGDMKFRPGEYKRADSNGAALKDNIVPLPMPEPSVVLFQLMEFLLQSADDIALLAKGVSDMPANVGALTGLAIVEQGMQAFKAVFKRIHRSLKTEFKRLYDLNHKYLTQEDYQAVLDDPDADVKKDYSEDAVYIIPVSDPEMVTNIEMVMRAQILEAYKDDPLIDPVEVRKRIFESVNIKEIDKLIKIPPKVPDELVEAQKTALAAQAKQAQAETEKLNRDNEREDIRLALEIEDTMAGIQQKVSTSVLNLSKAEAAEHGLKLDAFMATLKQQELRLQQYAPSITGRAQQLAQPPNNTQGAPVPAGLPPSGG